ncbi:unnamed protein product, partial [Nesidiocoris tenuis]
MRLELYEYVLNSSDPLLEGGRARPGQLRLSGQKPTPGTAVYFYSLITELQYLQMRADHPQFIKTVINPGCEKLFENSEAELQILSRGRWSDGFPQPLYYQGN